MTVTGWLDTVSPTHYRARACRVCMHVCLSCQSSWLGFSGYACPPVRPPACMSLCASLSSCMFVPAFLYVRSSSVSRHLAII